VDRGLGVEVGRDPVRRAGGLELGDRRLGVPMVNDPAGTQTCSIPNASVRTWPAVEPSDGAGVGATDAGVTDGPALGAPEGVAASPGAVAEPPEDSALGPLEDAAPAQPATASSTATAVAIAAGRGRRGSSIA
jgi:hypothetical protein